MPTRKRLTDTNTNLILIGPLAAGKTTVGKLLGEALAAPVVEIDDLRWDYYAEIGYDPDYAEKRRLVGGLKSRGDYWKPFEAHAVERLLADYPSGYILPLGAGNTVYNAPAIFARVQEALAPYPYVVLLLPMPDLMMSLHVLTERFRSLVPDITEEVLDEVVELNRHFLTHPSNSRLATYTVYTYGKTAAQTCEEVLNLVD